KLATVHAAQGRSDDALRAYDEAIRVREKAFGIDHAQTVKLRKERDELRAKAQR
ncbi:MAG: tetratricopeptide repeat protein, partial [Acidobacteriaceae bacterium]|nr:tetratricopeptide repeat protein [Acidobacteriaceae bacterium]